MSGAKKPNPKAPPRRPAIAGANAKPEQGLKRVQHRNDFYKQGDKKLFIAAGISIIGMAIQSIVAMSVFTAKNERVYIATDKSGSLIELITLGTPNQKDSVVAQWVQNALVDTFSFNFTDYQRRLNDATMEWFTKEGGDGLVAALRSSGTIQSVIDRKMILSMTLDHTPILIQHGPLPNSGIYSWTLQANATMTYRTQSQEFSQPVKFQVQVDRRSVMDNAEGLGISKVIMQRR